MMKIVKTKTNPTDPSALISIIMPMYNCQETLSQSIASIQAQTRNDWELLLVNDGSTDQTSTIAMGLKSQDCRIRLFQLPVNSGAAPARNHALKHSRGRYVAFLDADDIWHPKKLEKQITFMQGQGAGLSFTAYSRVSETGALIENVEVPSSVDYHRLLKRNLLGALTVIYDSQKVGKSPMPELQRQHDFALWLEMTRQYGPAIGLNEDLATYRVSSNSLSANKLLAAQDIWRLFRNVEKLPLHRALWYFAHYTYYGLRYRAIQRPIKV